MMRCQAGFSKRARQRRQSLANLWTFTVHRRFTRARDGNRTHKFNFGFCWVRLLFTSVRVRLVLKFRFGSVRSVFFGLKNFL